MEEYCTCEIFGKLATSKEGYAMCSTCKKHIKVTIQKKEPLTTCSVCHTEPAVYNNKCEGCNTEENVNVNPESE